MSDNRVSVRIEPRGRVSKDGVIFADTRSPVINCTLIDQSATGACLEIHGESAIPKRFYFLKGGIKKSCLVLWQKGRRVGVRF